MLLPKHAVALGRIAAKNGSQPVLRTVHIERHNGVARAIATDGRRAVIFSWDEPDPREFPPITGISGGRVPKFTVNLPPRILADAARGIPSRTPKPILSFMLLDESNSETAHIAATDLENVTRAEAKAEEGNFPPVDDVIPRPEHSGGYFNQQTHGEMPFSHVRIGVNGKLLAETLATLVELAADDADGIVVLTVPITPNRPVRLDARSEDRKATAVVMPVSADFTMYETPRPQQTKAQTPQREPAKTAPRHLEAGRPAPAATPARVAPRQRPQPNRTTPPPQSRPQPRPAPNNPVMARRPRYRPIDLFPAG